ncbi:uncharacterized [Tachysurus ichikawai]
MEDVLWICLSVAKQLCRTTGEAISRSRRSAPANGVVAGGVAGQRGQASEFAFGSSLTAEPITHHATDHTIEATLLL